MKHKHADVMIALANDSSLVIEFENGSGNWVVVDNPVFCVDSNYRIKTEPKPDVVAFLGLDKTININKIIADYLVQGTYSADADHEIVNHFPHQLKLTFDGETGKLKSAEVIS